MFANPNPTATFTDDAPAQADGLDIVRRGLLELFEMGLDVARDLKAEVKAHTQAASVDTPAKPAALVAVASAYERAERSVRLTATLLQRFDEPLPVRPPEPSKAERRVAARKQIIRAAEDAIHRECDRNQSQRLEAELHDRMDMPDIEDDIANRPVADVIAEVLHDLGLAALPGSNPWRKPRTPEDLAVLAARAAQPPAPAAGGPDISDADTSDAATPRPGPAAAHEPNRPSDWARLRETIVLCDKRPPGS